MASLFISNKVNIESVVDKLLRKLQVKVSHTTIVQNLQDHPEYPSLLSISDSLNEWGVTNQAYKIDLAEFDPEDLYFPFIAHIPENGGRYLLITKIEGNQVYFSDEKSDNQQILLEDFLKRWQGIALHGTPNAINGEQRYADNRIKELLQAAIIPLAILSFIALIVLNFSGQSFNLSALLLSLIKVAGVGVSILLLMQSLNANNPFIANLCTLGGGNNDCNAILKSDAAKLTSWLSWSEVGFFYFTGSLLALLLLPVSLPFLAWLNVLALPYTLYSIGYQYKHKNWCVFCCVVQVLLMLEFVVNLSFSNLQVAASLNVQGMIILILAFLIPVLIWAFLKPFFLKSAQLSPVKQQLKQFKYNGDLFMQALKNQPRYAVSDDLMPIMLGNKEADTVITMVSNPFCGPCAKTHQILDEWLKYKDDFLVKVIFTSSDSPDDPKTKVSRHLSALSKLNDRTLLEQSLNDWYNAVNKNYEVWAAKYPIQVNEEFSIVTERQKKWCRVADIQHTPTILVNGYKLPEPYKLEDIKYLMP